MHNAHIFDIKLGLYERNNRYVLKDTCFTYHAYFCKRINRYVPRLIKSEEKATGIVVFLYPFAFLVVSCILENIVTYIIFFPL